MQRRLALSLLAVTVLAAAAAVVPVAHGTKPGADGLIVYTRYRFQNTPLIREVWVASPDGTGARKLDTVGPNLEDDQPDWSPDGASIAFQRCPSDTSTTGVCGIYTMHPDGSALTRLSPTCPRNGGLPKCVDDSTPAYSPDGKQLAFTRVSGKIRKRDGNAYSVALMVGDVQLHHLRRVTWFGPYAGDVKGAAWSPDGKRLVFAADKGTDANPSRGAALYVVNANGTGLRRLTPLAVKATDEPDWSPDGKTILFRGGPGSDVDPGGGNLYTIGADGSDLRQLTHFSSAVGLGTVRTGSYSPDGASIVFAASFNAIPNKSGQHPDLFVMRADGTDLRPMTRTINWEGSPDWGPKS